MMEPAGVEPATSCLQRRGAVRRKVSVIVSNHRRSAHPPLGLALPDRKLISGVLGRFGHWALA
jgi:hypothetical protein